LLLLLSSLPPPFIVFSNSIILARRLQTVVEEATLGPVRCLHGKKQQRQRYRALDGLREGSVRVLVTTDVAARGLDVPGIKV